MEIKNEIKGKDEKKQFVQRNMTDIQRVKLEKLMKNPEKPIFIPENKDKKDKEYVPPSFIRNVMGSSAGAGSGEFHVYRHLRRKEYARQKHMKSLSEKEILDLQYEEKLVENQRKADERTSKKREKRLKKKMKQKNKPKKPRLEEDKKSESEDISDDEKSNEEDKSQNSESEDTKNINIENTVGNEVPEKEADITGPSEQQNDTVKDKPNDSIVEDT